MSNARNLADIVTGNFDVPVGALGNANDASALTTGTLPVGRLPSSGVSASSLTTGTLGTARLASGTVVQVDYSYYSGATVGINNTYTTGQASVTLTRKLTNSKFLVIVESTIYRDTTSGWHYLGFTNSIGGTVWFNTKDGTSWTRHSMSDLRTYAGNAGDSMTFNSANYNTANQTDQLQANALTVMEIAP